MPAIAAPRGTRDLLPAEAAAWEWFHRTHARVAASFGYRGIDTPIFEATELFARGVGTGTDVVDKEMYTFEDRSGRSMTLRPENTAGVVRAVLSSHLEQECRPVRVHYAGPMFRYDKPQAGRYRQFFQVGAECIGERWAQLDAEIIEMVWRFFEALQLQGVVLHVNTLGDIQDRQRYRGRLVDYFTPLQSQLCNDCQRRLTTNPLRMLDCKRDAAIVAGAPPITASLSAESREYFATVLDYLKAGDIPYSINERLVRGLDYYAHTAFEFWHQSLQGAQNALGGGGRYDGLAEVLGFAATPGVGYALGVERILAVASEQHAVPAAAPVPLISVCSAKDEAGAEALALARQLRQSGWSTVGDASPRRLEKKLRDVARQGARFAVLVGMNEGLVVRDMNAHVQEVLGDAPAMVQYLREQIR